MEHELSLLDQSLVASNALSPENVDRQLFVHRLEERAWSEHLSHPFRQRPTL